MNNRQKALLRILLSNPTTPFKARQLADELQCSEKTIRNDLHILEHYLSSYPSGQLVKKPGVGIYLDIQHDDRTAIFQKLFQVESKTDNERIVEIAYQLLTSGKPVTLKKLGEQYYTNQRQIKQDFHDIQRWLERFDLEILSKQRAGSRIVGTEIRKRNALAHLVELCASGTVKNYIVDLFPTYEIQAIQKLLERLQDNYSFTFTDGGFESLLIHSLVMIRRIRQGSMVTITDMDRDFSDYKQAFAMAEWLLQQMGKDFRITFPGHEKIYFTWHLISSMTETNSELRTATHDTMVERVADALSTQLQFLTMIHFRQDIILLDGLKVHLHAVLNRISYGFAITNPLLSNIKKMYPYMFSMVMFALEDVNQTFQLSIPEDEAAYLVLHFQASVERFERKRHTKERVLIVCHMGVGMSRLLQAKLEQQYKGINIVDCIGKRELPTFLKVHVIDRIISTVPLDGAGVPYVMVSPLLETKDKVKLSEFFQEHDAILQGSDAMLSPLMDKDYIFTNVSLSHRYEVLELLVNKLVEKGMVTKAFARHAFSRERLSPTAIGGGVAIPHGRPEEVKESCVAIAVLDKPLEWGNEMVSVVFLLAISADMRKKTRSLIGQISKISEDPVFIKKLMNAMTPNEVARLCGDYK